MVLASAIRLQSFGLATYQDIWHAQLELLEKRVKEEVPDTLFWGEHFSVFTLGRKSPGVRDNPDSLPKSIAGVPVHTIERGGEATYHGPGQLVMYPIFRLCLLKTGPRKFLRLLEESIIQVCCEWGIDAFYLEGKTGVWVLDDKGRERKLASLGIAVRHSVSYHGLAVNLNNDLAPFRHIQPCGFSADVMTSLSMLTGTSIDMENFAHRLSFAIEERFSLAMASKP